MVAKEECPSHEEGEAISAYAKRRKAFLVPNKDIGNKIKAMKRNDELLPIKPKYRK